ncbi:ArsR/SmtB family transcription factor, partial [Streptomyces bacillaris]|uniref:ArsR/SmtB family transcription factor n=1 Tax=Streptomyces bacillaris TaxID=68179 RepID=UPI003692E621
MSTPLYRLKAEFFKTLGHPVRIRVLELLSEREHAVSEMLAEVGVECPPPTPQIWRVCPAPGGSAPRGGGPP